MWALKWLSIAVSALSVAQVSFGSHSVIAIADRLDLFQLVSAFAPLVSYANGMGADGSPGSATSNDMWLAKLNILRYDLSIFSAVACTLVLCRCGGVSRQRLTLFQMLIVFEMLMALLRATNERLKELQSAEVNEV